MAGVRRSVRLWGGRGLRPGFGAALAVAFVWAAGLAHAPQAVANVFVTDQREFRDADQPLLRSVGMLVNARRQVGTAFLVGECHVLTAFHSAFFRDAQAIASDELASGPRPGHALEFYIGPDPFKPGRFRTRTTARVVDYGNYHPGAPRGMTGDWAILELEDCVGRDYGFLPYLRPTSADLVPRGPLMTIGFPTAGWNRPGVAVEEGCRVRESGPVTGLMAVDCAFGSGMSGGPVLERQADGRWLVVGLMQLRFSPVERVLPAYVHRHRNQMLHAVAFFRSLDRILAGSSGRASAPDPSSEREVAFERAAVELVLRARAEALHADPEASIALWRGDLNRDAVSELILRLCGREAARQVSCSLHVLTRDSGGRPRLAGMLPDAGGRVRLGFAQVNGWRPLIVGGGGRARGVVFDGLRYRALESGASGAATASTPGSEEAADKEGSEDEEIMRVETLLAPLLKSLNLSR